MKTFTLKASEIKKQWYVVDATDLVLGRMASVIAKMLRGKHKPEFTPHLDCGDNIIVINAEKVKVTGNKMLDKIFYWHTNHPGGIKQRTVAETLRSKQPERLIIKAVERMISRNALGRQQMSNLHVYGGSEHPHAAQQPTVLDIAAMNSKNIRN